MPRSLSPTFLAQLKSSGVSEPVLFVVLAFADNTLYLFNGVGSLTPAGPAYSALSTFPYGQTFTGVGWLGKFSTIPQTTKIQAQNITLALSGISSSLLNEAIGQVRMTGTATIFLGFFNPSTGALITDPVQLFSGALDVPTLNDSGDTSTISITAENPLISLNLAPERLFDDADQQIYYPGDLGFSMVDKLPNIPLYWPSPSTSGSPYPVTFSMSPQGADLAPGGTLTMSTTMTFSDGSFYTRPAGSGTGPHWIGSLGSSNPLVATVDDTGLVTARGPGICLISVRSPYGNPSGEYRCCTTLIVHS